jgi:hypothetical protein
MYHTGTGLMAGCRCAQSSVCHLLQQRGAVGFAGDEWVAPQRLAVHRQRHDQVDRADRQQRGPVAEGDQQRPLVAEHRDEPRCHHSKERRLVVHGGGEQRHTTYSLS